MEALKQLERLLNRVSDFGVFTDGEEKAIEKYILEIELEAKIPTEYSKFLEAFNRITGKKYLGDIESRRLFYEKQSFYTLDERIKAVENAHADEWTKENVSLSPKYILKPENTGRFLNMEKKTPKTSKNGIQPITETQDI